MFRAAYKLTVAPGSDGLEEAIARCVAAGGGIVELDAGVYRLSAALALAGASDVAIVGKGSDVTTLIPAAANTGAAGRDTYTNRLISVVGTTSTSTTLSAHAAKGDMSFTVASGTGLAAGQYLEISGTNATDAYDDSVGPSITTTEIVRVASVNGATVTLEEPLTQFHASSSTVKVCALPSGIVLAGLTVDAGASTYAVGIGAERARSLRLYDVAATGFSRAAVELAGGVRGFEVDTLRGLGSNNSLLMLRSATRGNVRNVVNTPLGSRYLAAGGVPRGLVSCLDECANVTMTNLHLGHGCVGLRVWGGRSLQFNGVHVEDMDNTAAYAAAVTAGELTTGAVQGVGIDTGAAPLAIADFSHGVQFRDVIVDNCRGYTPNGYGIGKVSVAFYWHDCKQSSVSGVNINPNGTFDGNLGGFMASDSTGDITGLTVSGCLYGFHTQNVLEDITVTGYRYWAQEGDAAGTNTGIAYLFDNTGSSGARIAFFGAYHKPNFGGVMRFGSSFAAGGAIDLSWRDSWFNEKRWAYVTVGYNAGAALSTGDLVAMSYASSRIEVAATAGGERHVATVVSGSASDYGTGYLAIAPIRPGLAQWVTVTGTVAAGDQLIASATAKKAETDNTPTTADLVVSNALTGGTNTMIRTI